jgi:hypothetical protein
MSAGRKIAVLMPDMQSDVRMIAFLFLTDRPFLRRGAGIKIYYMPSGVICLRSRGLMLMGGRIRFSTEICDI